MRIEDTDLERNKPEWIDGIQSAFRWIGVEWDEGPDFQSERSELYKSAAERLLTQGNAYHCDCTREVVEARTSAQHIDYDGFCCDTDPDPVRERRCVSGLRRPARPLCETSSVASPHSRIVLDRLSYLSEAMA